MIDIISKNEIKKYISDELNNKLKITVLEKTESTNFEITMMRIRKKDVHEIDRND